MLIRKKRILGKKGNQTKTKPVTAQQQHQTNKKPPQAPPPKYCRSVVWNQE